MPSDPILLRSTDVARRLDVSLPTLARWRRLGSGPPFIKRYGTIFYRTEDILDFERQRDRLRTSTREEA